MSDLRILNGNIMQLRVLLGPELACKLDLQPGDTALIMETEETKAVGREVFESLISQGWVGYALNEEGKTKKQLRDFDPEVFRIVMFAPVVGG